MSSPAALPAASPAATSTSRTKVRERKTKKSLKAGSNRLTHINYQLAVHRMVLPRDDDDELRPWLAEVVRVTSSGNSKLSGIVSQLNDSLERMSVHVLRHSKKECVGRRQLIAALRLMLPHDPLRVVDRIDAACKTHICKYAASHAAAATTP